jgi:hypothetical protein
MEQHMSRLEEIKKRWSAIPENLEVVPFYQQAMMRDPQDPQKAVTNPTAPKKLIRIDVFDKADVKTRRTPIFHIHHTPEHPEHNPLWKEVIDFYVQLREDMKFLIDQVGEK